MAANRGCAGTIITAAAIVLSVGILVSIVSGQPIGAVILAVVLMGVLAALRGQSATR